MPKTINEVDKHVGERVRLARLSRGLSQEKLADAIGVTFQQVQKYENGHNRISASRLYACARYLGVDILYFYQDVEKITNLSAPELASENIAMKWSRAELRALKALHQIQDDRVRRQIYALIEAVAAREGIDMGEDAEEDADAFAS